MKFIKWTLVGAAAAMGVWLIARTIRHRSEEPAMGEVRDFEERSAA